MNYWQHEHPLRCPKRHKMLWLGSVFWICGKCHQLYVETVKEEVK